MVREPEVEVLLATFQGARFLREQVESILAQSYPGVRVLARDDGSSDGTSELLGEYAARFPERFRVMETRRPTGSAKGNFLELMRAATGAYVAFADQDDVWLPDKVRLSMEAMRGLEQGHAPETPLLVFTDLRVVDDALRTVADSMWGWTRVDPRNAGRLHRLLGQNVVTGCTMLVNRPLLELARRMPEEATMHDRWMALLASSMGAVTAVREPTVLYRQHGANVVGAPAVDHTVRGTAARAGKDAARRRERACSEEQAEALLAVYGDGMGARSQELLRAYLRSGRSSHCLVRLWTACRYGFFRTGLVRNLAMLFDLARGPSVSGEDPES